MSRKFSPEVDDVSYYLKDCYTVYLMIYLLTYLLGIVLRLHRKELEYPKTTSGFPLLPSTFNGSERFPSMILPVPFYTNGVRFLSMVCGDTV